MTIFIGYSKKFLTLLWQQVAYFINSNINRLLFRYTTNKNFQLKNIKTVIINLDRRPDRLSSSLINLQNMGILNISKFSAIEDIYPQRGCAASHLSVLQSFHDSNEELILICEDDIKFIGNILSLKKTVNNFISCKELNILCIANLTKSKSKNLTKYLHRANEVQTTACYLIKRPIVGDLITNAKKSINELTLSGAKSGSIDKTWKSLQTEHIFAVPKSRLCVQLNSYSDIEKKKVYYTY
jgi:GR25 family glycosyltransferase involved in LPS biosynthesis